MTLLTLFVDCVYHVICDHLNNPSVWKEILTPLFKVLVLHLCWFCFKPRKRLFSLGRASNAVTSSEGESLPRTDTTEDGTGAIWEEARGIGHGDVQFSSEFRKGKLKTKKRPHIFTTDMFHQFPFFALRRWSF